MVLYPVERHLHEARSVENRGRVTTDTSATFSQPNIRREWKPCQRKAQADGADTFYTIGKCVVQKHEHVYFCTMGVGGNMV